MAQQTGSDGAPFVIWIAGFIGFSRAIFLTFMGIIGFASADEVSDSFGMGVFAAGVIFALLTYFLVKGKRWSRDVLVVLSGLSVLVGLGYAIVGPNSALITSLIVAGMSALFIYIVTVPARAKAFFA